MNQIRDTPILLVKLSDENISEITENLEKFFIDYAFVQKLTTFSKKRLDLWLFRHKSEIIVLKHNKQKFISLNILTFLPKMLQNHSRKR